MYTHSKGIILRTVKYSESSLILDMFTSEKGRRSYIISGIRSKQAKTKAGVLQVMGLVDFVSYDKDTTSLLRIKEIKADALYQRIPFEVLRSCLGVFIMEICSKSIKGSEPNMPLYDFIKGSLLRLDRIELQKMALFHIKFLLGLSKHLGFAIQNNYNVQSNIFSLRDGSFGNYDYDYDPELCLNEKDSLVLSQMIRKEEFRAPKSQRDHILDMLILYYRFHLEDFGNIKSLEVLRSLFS